MSILMEKFFDHGPESRQSDHDKTVFPHGSHHHAEGHGQQNQSVEKTVIPLVLVKHLTPVPPLSVIIEIKKKRLLCTTKKQFSCVQFVSLC